MLQSVTMAAVWLTTNTEGEKEKGKKAARSEQMKVMPQQEREKKNGL